MGNLLILICTFLTLTIVLSTGFSVQNRETNRADVRVIVIGAGAAGVTAASKLHATGKFNVTLFEAQDRIGGRTHTIKKDGIHFEMGGEWIHGEVGNSIFEIMDPLGALIDTSKKPTTGIPPLEFGDEFTLTSGETVNVSLSDTFRELLDYMWHDPEGWGDDLEDDVSMGLWAEYALDRFIRDHQFHTDHTFVTAVFDWAHRVTNAEDASDNWYEKSSTGNGEQYVELEGFANIPWNPPYSYASLFQYLLTGSITEEGTFELPSWIHLNKEVVRISYSTQRETVEVCTADGACEMADHVIYTPSLGVLKATFTQVFRPTNLPVKKIGAIENLGFGSATKYVLEFSEPWWPLGYEGTFLLWDDREYYTDRQFQYWRKDITLQELMYEMPDGLPLWTRSILNIFTVDSGSAPNMIRIWVTGMPSRFMDSMDPAYLESVVMRVIHKFLDDKFPNITDPIATYQSKWASNPFTRGVYSYRTLNSESQDVWAADLAEPILNLATSKPLVCFAGEATHPNYFSTVHGAHDTGVREFNRIISYYPDN